jgi:hypothetical protein
VDSGPVFNLSWRWAECDEDAGTKARVISGRDVNERKRSDNLSMLLGIEGDKGTSEVVWMGTGNSLGHHVSNLFQNDVSI